MGLFGPSKQEMQDAVADGIHQAIRTSHYRGYEVKQGKKMVQGEYYVVPPEISVTAYDPNDKTPTPPLRKIKMPNGYFVIYDVIEYREMTRFNPFTDVRTTDRVNESNVARYYSYDGWNMDKIQRLIRYAKEKGYYPSEEWMQAEALSNGL